MPNLPFWRILTHLDKLDLDLHHFEHLDHLEDSDHLEDLDHLEGFDRLEDLDHLEDFDHLEDRDPPADDACFCLFLIDF